jgi:hypothetical protein
MWHEIEKHTPLQKFSEIRISADLERDPADEAIERDNTAFTDVSGGFLPISPMLRAGP